MPAIGIDLGTTNSCMGVFRNGKVEIIPNEFGQRTTASCVAFTETGRLVGDAARDQAFNNPTNTISESKRIIGRKFDEQSVRADMLHLAYKVESDRFGRACMRVTYKGESRLTYPEEVAAHVLGKLRSLAERYLGETVRDAVITVPAYFNDAQRQATRDAGQLAGFNVLRILNEPTAASLAYGLADCEGGQTASCELQCIAGVDSEEQTVLIFDFGGGTLDVSVLSIDSGIFEVRSTAGNTHLGGADFDNRLMNHVLRQYARQVLQPPVCTVESVREEVEKVSLHGGAAALDACVRAAKSDAVWMRRVRTECERAKCALSTQPQASVELELHSPADSRPDRVRVTITREEFEKECADLFRATAEPVRRALDDARLEPARIDRVVLVGGASRMPNVRQMFITQFGFDAARIHDTVDPDVAIAYGAAIQAALLSGVRDSAVDDVLLIDVTPLSLGVETVGGVMNVLIQRNTTIPVSVKKIFTTHFDNQPAVEISVFQGERRLTAHNELLGMFELCGIREAPGGVPQIQVTFEVDANGILIVHATELGNTLPQCNVDQRVISVCRRDRSGWFESMARDAEQYRDQDEASVASIQAHATLEAYVRSLKRTLTETLAKRAANYNQPQSDASASASAALNGVDLEAIEEQCDSLVNWLEQTRADRSIAAEEFQKRGMQLDALCAPLLAAVGKAPLSEAASRAPQQTGWSSHDNVD